MQFRLKQIFHEQRHVGASEIGARSSHRTQKKKKKKKKGVNKAVIGKIVKMCLMSANIL